MVTPLSRLTPGQVSRLATLFALLVAFALTAGYATARMTVEAAGIGSFFLALSLLLALPGQRSSELLGAMAIWMTYAEFMAAAQSGTFDLWRWAVALATLALVIVPLKVQHLRQLARTNPYQPIETLDRRMWAGVVPAPSMTPMPEALLAIRNVADEPAPSACT